MVGQPSLGGADDIVVQAVPLDEVVTEDVEVLKIDVEGWDGAVLQGASRLLSAGKVSHIFVEWDKQDSNESTTLLQWLHVVGYRVYVLPEEAYEGDY